MLDIYMEWWNDEPTEMMFNGNNSLMMMLWAKLSIIAAIVVVAWFGLHALQSECSESPEGRRSEWRRLYGTAMLIALILGIIRHKI